MRCFIVCTGSSLRGFDFDRLKGHDVIAVNHAIKYVEAKYMVAIDFKSVFEKPEWKEIIKDTPIIVDSIITSNDFNLLIMERGKIEGFDLRPNRVASGSNSGYMAINAAYHLGYREIYLLGMDMGKIYNERYFDRPGYIEPKGSHPDYNYVLPWFETMVKEMPTDLKVYNCSLQSHLNVFPKISIYDII